MKKIILIIFILLIFVRCQKSDNTQKELFDCKDSICLVISDTNISDFTVTANNDDNISGLFERYLKEVCKIEEPPKDQTYIIISLLDCPSCIPKYLVEIEKIYNDKNRKLYPSLIVVGRKDMTVPQWFNKILEAHKNIYYDEIGAYHRINITPNISGFVEVKDGKITNRTIISIENYKHTFEYISKIIK